MKPIKLEFRYRRGAALWDVVFCSIGTGDIKDYVRTGIPKCAAIRMTARLNRQLKG